MRKILRSLRNYLRFSRKGNDDMPGVADTIRRTQLKQEHESRKKDMDELLRMVKEGRIHEADERQLEMLKLALELNSIVNPQQGEQKVVVEQDSDAVVSAVREAVAEILTNLPQGTGGVSQSGVSDPARPKMKHSSLSDIKMQDADLDVSHTDTLGETKEGEADSSDKLDRLRKLKGSK